MKILLDILLFCEIFSWYRISKCIENRQTNMLDYLIKNAKIVDGTDAPPYKGAICISGDKIITVIPEGEALPEAKTVIDVDGKLMNLLFYRYFYLGLQRWFGC